VGAILIGVTGKARSGKDSMAEYLRTNYRFASFAFADPIKEAASIIFNIPLKMFYDGDREDINQYWGISYREMLQKLGTESCRNVFRQDIWVKRAQLTLDGCHREGYNNVIITDVRFEDEAKFIRINFGKVIHILRQEAVDKVSEATAAHSSEAGIALHEGDITITNNDSIEAFHKQIDRIMLENFNSSPKL